MIALFGACADSNVLLALDVAGLFTDEGQPIDARFRPQHTSSQGVSNFHKLREVVQAVAVRGPVTVRVTPYVDGGSVPDQAQEFSLATIDGLEQFVELPAALEGSRFSYEVEVLAMAGPVAFGEASMDVVAKRGGR